MNVDVKCEFADERYNLLVEDWYKIKTCSVDDKSTYTRKERNIDRFFSILLSEMKIKNEK